MVKIMTEKSKTGIAIVASVLIAMVATTGLIYFLSPYLFPQKGVVQTQTLSLTSNAYIFDSSTTAYTVVNQTQMSIVTRGGSFLDIRFTVQAVISLDTTFTGAADWWVSVVVNTTSSQVGNRTALPHFFDDHVALGNFREIPTALSIEYQTPVLAKGTYTISVQWVSRTDSPGSNYLLFANNNLHTPRVLLAQEIVQ
jgi:hypothetical protein